MDPCLVENNLDVGPGPYSLHAVNHEDFSGCIILVGNVKSPLISLGRLIKCGWKLTHSDDQICLSNGCDDIWVGMRKNTLVVNANIRAVGAEEDYEPEVFPVGISNLHGWHVMQGEVLAFVDLEAREYHGGEDIAEEEFYKARVTFLVEGPDCQVLENDSNYMRQSQPCGRLDEYTPDLKLFCHTITVFFPGDAPLDLLAFPYAVEQDLFEAQPDSSEQVSAFPSWKGDEEEFPRGEGVDEEEMQFQPEDEDQGGEVVLDELRLSLDMTLKQLRSVCQKCGLSSGGGKAKCLARLKQHQQTMQMKLTQEVAAKMFQEERREVRSGPIPKLPDEKAQAQHRLSHLPYAPWCPSYVAGRARNGPHRSADEEKKAEAGVPVLQLDYGYGFTDAQGNTVREVHENQHGTTSIASGKQVGTTNNPEACCPRRPSSQWSCGEGDLNHAEAGSDDQVRSGGKIANQDIR